MARAASITPEKAAQILRDNGYHDRAGTWRWLTPAQVRYFQRAASGRGRNPMQVSREGRDEWDLRFGRESRLKPPGGSARASSRLVRRAAYGFVLWEGPSAIGGLVMRGHEGQMQHVRADVPLVLIATFGDAGKANVKTGRMIQTYILVRDVDPVTAVEQGLDESNCGFCQHRDPRTGKRTCYVRLDQPTGQAWQAYQRGVYATLAPFEIGPMFALLGQQGYRLRMGTYGDPAAVPFEVWATVLGLDDRGQPRNLPLSKGHPTKSLAGTCYTHQWQHPAVQALKSICMASVDNDAQLALARRMGWRSFQPVSMWRPKKELVRGRYRFRPPTTPEIRAERDARLATGQVLCPASQEFGQLRGIPLLTCDQCRLCCGGLKEGAKDVWIPVHGMGRSGAIKAARKKYGTAPNPCPCGGACGCPGENPLPPRLPRPEGIRTICMSCGRHMAGHRLAPRVSHGYCRPCAEAEMQKFGRSLDETPRGRANPDEDLRRLERDAEDDVSAATRLAHELARHGRLPRGVRPEAVLFFYEHAGYAVGHRFSGAVDLAHAERDRYRRGWHVRWEPSPEAWDGDVPLGPDDLLLDAALYVGEDHPQARPVATLGMIAVGSVNDPYMRVVEAELAHEALSAPGQLQRRRRRRRLR